MISNTLSDDVDIKREIRNMFTRTNILARRFAKCSVAVKVELFKAYCICLYDAGLWSRYKVESINSLMSCYNKCLKLFFQYKRRDSVTQILLVTGLPSASTILFNSTVTFNRSWCVNTNDIVKHFNAILSVS